MQAAWSVYACASTDEQGTDPQLDELRAAGCAIFEAHAFDADRDRPVLTRLLRKFRPGETLVVGLRITRGWISRERASSASGPAMSRHRRYRWRNIMPDATNTPCPAAGPVAAVRRNRIVSGRS